MRLKLNRKSVYIKPADNLTVEEYIEFSTYEKIGLIEYLQVVTGYKFADIASSKLKPRSIRKINTYIGTINPFQELEKLASKKVLFEYQNEVFNTKSFDIDTLGFRTMIESRLKSEKNILNVSVYALAVLLEGNFDAEKAEDIYVELLQKNYLDTLPFALFFFKSWNRGSRRKSRLYRILQKIISPNTASR